MITMLSSLISLLAALPLEGGGGRLFLIIIVAVLPALLLGYYLWYIDSKREPAVWLIGSVVLGALVCLPVVYLKGILSSVLFSPAGVPVSLFESVVDTFCLDAVLEEVFKFVAFFLVVFRNRYFDEHYDGIIYAACVGLGFAAVEDIFYLFSQPEWEVLPVLRSILSVLGHSAYAVLMGYYYSLYRFVSRTRRNLVFVLLIPILVHAVFNTLLLPFWGGLSMFLFFAFCVFIHRTCRKKIAIHLANDIGFMNENYRI